MINDDCFTLAWITQKSSENKNADKILLEKVIYALSLLEHLQLSGLDFIFKGGTSLTLLMPEIKRFSIDIDIIMTEKRDDLEIIFQAIVEKSRFIRFVKDERQTTSKIDKAHYKFYYQPATATRGNEEYILLDIVYMANPYTHILEKTVENKLIDTVKPAVMVRVPSLEDILGDKLTAFAPNTTGIPYGKEMEIIKQLFDIGNLFDLASNLEIISQTFKKIVETELINRNLIHLTWKDVLMDSFETAFTLCLRDNENEHFQFLQNGIKQIKNFIFSENYLIEKAIVHAAKVAYLTVLIQNEATTIEKYNGDSLSIKDLIIENTNYNKLNKFKKTSPEAFFYWYQALRFK